MTISHNSDGLRIEAETKMRLEPASMPVTSSRANAVDGIGNVATDKVAALPAVAAETAKDPRAEAAAAFEVHRVHEMMDSLQEHTPGRRATATFAAAHRLHKIKPRDPIEQMIAAQMIALHAVTIEGVRRASLPDQSYDGRRGHLGMASKTSRAFVALVEALDRHRRGGEQKITVEHVHVHAGGQAIVGNITGGRGRSTKRLEQPDGA